MLTCWELRAQVLFVSALGQNQSGKEAHSGPRRHGCFPCRAGAQTAATAAALWLGVLTHEPKPGTKHLGCARGLLVAVKATEQHLWSPGTWELVEKVNYTETQRHDLGERKGQQLKGQRQQVDSSLCGFCMREVNHTRMQNTRKQIVSTLNTYRLFLSLSPKQYSLKSTYIACALY